MTIPPAPMPDPADQTVAVRRPRAAQRLIPRELPADTGVVISRNVLRSSVTTAQAQTSRERRIAGDLPEWEPLPPGELFVTRPST